MFQLVSYDFSSDEADCSGNEDDDDPKPKSDIGELILDDDAIISSLLKELVNKIGDSEEFQERPAWIDDRTGNSDMCWRDTNSKMEISASKSKIRRKRRRDDTMGDEKSSTDWSDVDSSDSSSSSSSSHCELRVSKTTKPKSQSDHEFSEDSDYVYARIVLESQKPRPNFQRSGYVKKSIKTKGELDLDDLPPIENLCLSVPENANLRRIGVVTSTVDKLAIVQSDYGVPPLDEESWLVDEQKRPLGQIFEVFGPVPRPFYSIRFNKTDDLLQRLKVGSKVFFIPGNEAFTRTIFADSLRQMKGSDASWEDNNEPPAEALEFSDDEEERRFKAHQRGKTSAQDQEQSESSEAVSDRPKAIPRRRFQRGRGRGDNSYQQIRHPIPDQSLFPPQAVMKNPWAFAAPPNAGPFPNFSPMPPRIMPPMPPMGPRWPPQSPAFRAPLPPPFPMPSQQRSAYEGAPIRVPPFGPPPSDRGRGRMRYPIAMMDTRYFRK